MRFLWLSSLLILTSFGSAQAETSRMAQLLDVMQLDGLLQIMAEENIQFSTTMEAEMFPEQGGAAWQAEMAALYDPAKMRADLAASFESDMTPETYDGVLGFFQSELGQRLVLLENDTRRALMDPDLEKAAEENMINYASDEPDRFQQVEEFAEVNDLIDSNVMSGLNANFAFYNGMIDGNGFPYTVTEDQALAETWAGEEEMRAETKVWLFSFLTLAYSSLSTDEMDQYIAFSASDAGQKFNRVLFDGFDRLFVDLSYNTGLAAARRMSGQDI